MGQHDAEKAPYSLRRSAVMKHRPSLFPCLQLRDRERRLKLRELKIVQQQQAQAERLRRTRQRAMAEVVRHTGRPLVFRSRPPTPQQLQRKTAKETEEELEEFNYFFGE